MDNENLPEQNQDDAIPAAIQALLKGLKTDHVVGTLSEVGVTKDPFNRKKPYGRVEPADGSAAVAIAGLPQGRINGVPIGTLAVWQVIPSKGNFLTYLGHTVIKPEWLLGNSVEKALMSKTEAQAQIQSREKAASELTPEVPAASKAKETITA